MRAFLFQCLSQRLSLRRRKAGLSGMILIVLINSGVAVSAEQVQITGLTLYPEGIPGEIAHTPTEFQGRVVINDRSVVAVDSPELTMVAPPEDERNGTAVIILPGGGYERLAIDKEGFNVARRFAGAGITAFVLKYRMPLKDIMDNPSYGPLQDAQQAISLVRQHAKEWGIDSDRVGVMGFSAGGHLAATLATQFKQPVNKAYTKKILRPDFQVLIYPVISMKEDVTHQGSRLNLLGESPDNRLISTFSAQDNVTTNTPQAFIVHANDDKAVPVGNALQYHAALVEKRVPVQMLLLPDGGHGFGMNHPTDWFSNMLEWMENYGVIAAQATNH